MRLATRLSAAVALLLFPPAVVSAQTGGSYSSPVDRSTPTRVYWGDTHVHTSLSSSDANLSGLNTDKPEIAYRFARGETVAARNGMPVRLRRPLDFLVIADHAEGLGVSVSLQSADPALLETSMGRKLDEAFRKFSAKEPTYANRRAFSGESSAMWGEGGEPLDEGYRRTVWHRVVELADVYNDPGTFTALAGYEWTSRGTPAQADPRWTAFDAKFYGIENIPEEVRMVSQERVYTSPIWYSPR